MATYKVLQDIEAEDKLLGPLTLKQFIFASIFIGLGFIGFTILTSPAPSFLKAPFIAVLLLPMFVFGFLAAPIGRDQPNDLWLLARLRFLFKPRKRIWSQDGLSNLVTITAPKKVLKHYTDGLDQTEVRSRLEALASTMDTRGWAVKNVATNLFAQPGYLTNDDSDRLVAASTLPQDNIAADVSAADDIMDEANNQTAHHLDQLVQESTKAQRARVNDGLAGKKTQAQATQDYWFMNQNQPSSDLPQDYSMFNDHNVVQPGAKNTTTTKVEETDAEKEFAHRLTEEHNQQISHITDHMKTLQPLHDRDGKIVQMQNPPQDSSDDQTKQSDKTQQTKPNPAIIGLANNDDLNITTIAREANKSIKGDDDEVVISLH